jgi:hypothetical protein
MLLSRAYLPETKTFFFLQNLDDWSFDVFAVNEAADNHSLKFVGYELLQKYDLIAKYKISSNVLDVFLLNYHMHTLRYVSSMKQVMVRIFVFAISLLQI